MSHAAPTYKVWDKKKMGGREDKGLHFRTRVAALNIYEVRL